MIAGLLLPTLVELAVSGRFQVMGFASDGSAAPFQGPMTIFIGYLVGALCAELSVPRRVEPANRSAAASGVPVLRWTMWPLAAIAFVLSIRACLDIAHIPWRVRRSIAHSTGVPQT